MNKYIIGSGGSGKTRKMLEEAEKSGAIVVCKNPYSMAIKAKSYGLTGLKFMMYEEVNSEMIQGEKIAIDELRSFFKYCLGVELDAFTMTVE